MYYCGWDGGGSKTCVCITDESGAILSEKIFGPINLNGTSADTVRNTIHDCINFMSSIGGGLTDCKGLVIGIAGISNSSAVEFIENTVRQCGCNCNLHVTGDHEIALAGAINGPGAILISGTGSVCFGMDANKKTFRCGGYGYLIDDEGSGYAIGRDILIAVTHAYDGRGPETCLTEAVFNQIQVNNQSSMISWLYSPETDKKQIANLAPLLLPALDLGDAAAKLIAERAAQHLASLVTTALKKADIQTGEVALIGSIFDYFGTIRKQVTEIIKRELPLVNLISPRHTPALGAANLAAELYR